MAKRLVLWNPKSGKAADAAPERARFLQAPDTTLEETESPADARHKAEQAAARGFDIVVAAGGDGTVNSVANGIIDSGADVTLGVMPIGTANDFAFSLGMPTELDAATDAVIANNARPLDIVELETSSQHWCYANVAAGGNSDRVTNALDDEMKATWGPLCYLRGALGVLGDMHSFHAQVVFDDDRPLEIDLWNIIVANGRTNAGRLHIAPRANLEDGLLDVLLIKNGDPIDMAALTARYLFSDFVESELVIYRQVRSLKIKSDPQMRFSIDGESIDDQPVVFRCLPGAVRMIVGPEYSIMSPKDA
jgi:diacylglycerol kinase (ATP)